MVARCVWWLIRHLTTVFLVFESDGCAGWEGALLIEIIHFVDVGLSAQVSSCMHCLDRAFRVVIQRCQGAAWMEEVVSVTFFEE